MKINNAIVGAFAVTALAALATPSHAFTTIPIGTSIGNAGSDINFSGTPTGELTETSAVGSYDNIVTGNKFTPVMISLTTTGPSTYTDFGGFVFTDTFTGGTFSVLSGTTTLLSGTFGASTLEGNIGADSGGLTASQDVVYTGGTQLNGLGPAGSLSLEFTSVNGGAGFSATPAGLAPFTATDDITFSAAASPAPEPSEVATLGFCAFGLLGLMVRARKASRSGGLAA